MSDNSNSKTGWEKINQELKYWAITDEIFQELKRLGYNRRLNISQGLNDLVLYRYMADGNSVRLKLTDYVLKMKQKDALFLLLEEHNSKKHLKPEELDVIEESYKDAITYLSSKIIQIECSWDNKQESFPNPIHSVSPQLVVALDKLANS